MKIYNLFNGMLDDVEDRLRKRSPVSIDEVLEKERQKKFIHDMSIKTFKSCGN